MKIWECDVCGKQEKSEKYPKDWFMIKLYSKAQSKGGTSKGYHICKKCKLEIFGK